MQGLTRNVPTHGHTFILVELDSLGEMGSMDDVDRKERKERKRNRIWLVVGALIFLAIAIVVLYLTRA